MQNNNNLVQKFYSTKSIVYGTKNIISQYKNKAE